MLAGLGDRLIVSTPQYMERVAELLGDSCHWGIYICYAPRGQLEFIDLNRR